MAINSRNKGTVFERQVAKALMLETGIAFKRDLDQYRERDRGDLIADAEEWPFLIECKAYAAGTDCKPKWWLQATAAAANADKLPCVIYKFNHGPIKCRVGIDAIVQAHGGTATTDKTADISLQGLAYLAREIMAGEKE